MMEFLAANFNLPTIIVAVIVFGGVGWITWHTHKHGGGCSGCSIEMIRKGRGLSIRLAPFFQKQKVSFG